MGEKNKQDPQNRSHTKIKITPSFINDTEGACPRACNSMKASLWQAYFFSLYL